MRITRGATGTMRVSHAKRYVHTHTPTVHHNIINKNSAAKNCKNELGKIPRILQKFAKKGKNQDNERTALAQSDIVTHYLLQAAAGNRKVNAQEKCKTTPDKI